MKVEVYPSDLKGVVSAPGSKSVAQRIVACALLARGTSIIQDYPSNHDCQAALNVAQALGAVITSKGSDVTLKGGYPNAFLSEIRNHRTEIFCGESGLVSRLFTPVAALSGDLMTIQGDGTLMKRPFHDFETILPPLGVHCETSGGFLPMSIKGPLQNGEITLNASVSSQFLTGLLIALPRTNGTSILHVQDLRSKPYIELTLQILSAFGVQIEHENFEIFTIKPALFQPQTIRVAGDWSGAAFLLVAGVLCAENGILVDNLSSDSLQADRAILDVLKASGAHVVVQENAIFVKSSEIRAFEFDANDCPDLFPPLAALAAFADGVSTIYGLRRLIHKESNRGKVLQQEFAKANIRIVLRDDEMKIYPASVRRAFINSHNDHRIAMAAAILGLAGDRITIKGAESVAKSFPHFFELLISLNGKIQMSPATIA